MDNLVGKFKRRKDGTWSSSCRRWRIARSGTGRYDLHDLSRDEGDTLYSMGHPTVAACEEAARGVVWAERQESE
jgi:hypothetical protein